MFGVGIKDQPGALANKLTTLVQAGADIDFIVARRAPDKPGTGVVFVAPLLGDQQVAAASEVGFSVNNSLHGVRVEGQNEVGIGAKLTRQLAGAGLNLRGVSSAVVSDRFIIYFAFDTSQDADLAISVLEKG